MFSLVIWFLVFPRLLYHVISIILLILLIISYKVFKIFKADRSSVIKRGKIMMMIRLNKNQNKRDLSSKTLHNVAQVTLAIIMVVWQPMPIECDNQDATIIKPVVSIAKSFINLVADKKQLDFDFTTSDVARSVGLLVWRAKFPMRMPNGVVQKTQDLVNRVTGKVNDTDVTILTRKTMSQLGQDMIAVVDSINDQVQRSSDGIYTDYLQTKVNGKFLEDALYDIALQMKAYQIDLINYRDLADMLLGLPIVPHVVGGINTAVSATPNIQTLKTITQSLINNSNQAASMARSVVQQGTNSMATIGNNIPGVSSISNIISTPISAVGNRVLNPSGVISRFIPSNATPEAPSA